MSNRLQHRQRTLLQDREAKLSPAMREGLKVLLRNVEVTKEARSWRGTDGGTVEIPTICALFDRYLIEIAHDGRRKPMVTTAKLTEIGIYVAETIMRDEASGFVRNRLHPISEEARRFIVEVVG